MNKGKVLMNKRKPVRSKGSWWGEYLLDEEIAERSKEIKKNPKNAEAYYYRGYAYQKKGNEAKAISELTKAIKADPKHVKSYLARAVLYFNKRDFKNSWKDVHKAEKLGSPSWPFFVKCLKKASGRKS